MQVSLLSFQKYPYRVKNTKSCQTCMKPILARDTVCFGSRDLLSLPEDEIFKKLNSAICVENLIGEGKDAKVYKIPQTNYCVRLDNLTKHEYGEYFSKSLTEEDKINHIVAKIGGNSTIMKYLEGYNAFVKRDDITASKRLFQDIKDMPVSAFQRLLNQFIHAMNNNMLFDCCGKNIIINPKEKTLTAIDFYKNSAEWSDTMYPLSSMYSALTNFYNDTEYKRVCANKILNAGLNEIESKKLQSFDFAKLDLMWLLKKLKDADLFQNLNYYRLMQKFLSDITDLKMEQYCAAAPGTDLYGKLKQTRALIKQLF